MWFKKKVLIPPPKEKQPHTYHTTELQIGDSCICLDDRPHDGTHQKLLVKGEKYYIRDMEIDSFGKDFPNGGPFIKLNGIVTINDFPWDCTRFQKISKQSKIIERLIEEPICVDIKKEFADANNLWKIK